VQKGSNSRQSCNPIEGSFAKKRGANKNFYRRRSTSLQGRNLKKRRGVKGEDPKRHRNQGIQSSSRPTPPYLFVRRRKTLKPRGGRGGSDNPNIKKKEKKKSSFSLKLWTKKGIHKKKKTLKEKKDTEGHFRNGCHRSKNKDKFGGPEKINRRLFHKLSVISGEGV